MYIDVHSHIDLLRDIPGAIERARKADVKIIINNGIDVKTNRKTLELAGKYPEVKAALGIYPTDCLKLSDEEIDAEVEFIRKNKNKIVGVGEVGLDFKQAGEAKRQRKNFGKFIELALELDKPIIVHSRQADIESVEFLEKLQAKKVIMHCYFGKLNLVKRIIDNGWIFSIPAIVKHNSSMQELVKIVPIKNILCETDSPFLHPDREGENEPAFVVEAYKKIAEIKNLKFRRVESAILENYDFLFENISDNL